MSHEHSSAIYPSLKGKNVFVTGGATGIGQAIVTALYLQGANVAFVDLLNKQGNELVEKLQALDGGEEILFECLDVCDHKQLQSSIDDASRTLGPIDILVNNVANDNRHHAKDTSYEDWQHCLNVNVNAAFVASQAVYTNMKENRAGAIINISSINALWGPDNMPGYVTAKAGLLGLTKALAREFGKDGIRVNAISPGWVKTERQKRLWLTDDAEKEWKKSLCLPEMIEPEEVAHLVLFLASDQAKKITSQNYIIDCGRI
ncbi:MAG: SDR family NAD(P)-dependent oxidoreductase [Bdellovibrionota bacterium]